MEQSMVVDALGECDFFEGLKPEDIEKIAALCRLGSYGVGETIFRQGDPGEHLYIIVDGMVYLERTFDLGGRKGRVTVETLGRGRALGCWATLLDEAHVMMSTATCRAATKILILKGSDLRRLMVSNELLGFNIMEKFCHLLLERIQAAYGALEKI